MQNLVSMRQFGLMVFGRNKLRNIEDLNTDISSLK